MPDNANPLSFSVPSTGAARGRLLGPAEPIQPLIWPGQGKLLLLLLLLSPAAAGAAAAEAAGDVSRVLDSSGSGGAPLLSFQIHKHSQRSPRWEVNDGEEFCQAESLFFFHEQGVRDRTNRATSREFSISSEGISHDLLG